MSGRGGGGRGGRGGRGASAQMSHSKSLLLRSAQEAGLDNDRQMMSLQEIVRPPLYPDIQWDSSPGSSATNNNSMHSQNNHQHPLHHPTTSNNNNNNSAAVPIKVEEDNNNNDGNSETQVPVIIAKRPASVVSMIQKQRQIFEAFTKSSHYVRQNPVLEISRYGQQSVRTAPDQNVLLSMSCRNTVVAASTMTPSLKPPPETKSMPLDGSNKPLSTNNTDNMAVYNKLATDERYFPAELLSTRKQLQSAQEARNPQKRTLTELLADEAKVETGEEEDGNPDDEDGEGYEEPEELEAEEMEDYTTNYYDTDDDASDGGDGEATF